MESLLKVTTSKWNMQSEEGGRGTEGGESGRQTETDWGNFYFFFNIRRLWKPHMSLDTMEADEVDDGGERKVGAWKDTDVIRRTRSHLPATCDLSSPPPCCLPSLHRKAPSPPVLLPHSYSSPCFTPIHFSTNPKRHQHALSASISLSLRQRCKWRNIAFNPSRLWMKWGLRRGRGTVPEVAYISAACPRAWLIQSAPAALAIKYVYRGQFAWRDISILKQVSDLDPNFSQSWVQFFQRSNQNPKTWGLQSRLRDTWNLQVCTHLPWWI